MLFIDLYKVYFVYFATLHELSEREQAGLLLKEQFNQFFTFFDKFNAFLYSLRFHTNHMMALFRFNMSLPVIYLPDNLIISEVKCRDGDYDKDKKIFDLLSADIKKCSFTSYIHS